MIQKERLILPQDLRESELKSLFYLFDLLGAPIPTDRNVHFEYFRMGNHMTSLNITYTSMLYHATTILGL